MSIIELVNIHESSHEESIVIFMTNKDLNTIKNISVAEDEDGNCVELSYQEKVYKMILIDSWYLGGEDIYISIINKLK